MLQVRIIILIANAFVIKYSEFSENISMVSIGYRCRDTNRPPFFRPPLDLIFLKLLTFYKLKYFTSVDILYIWMYSIKTILFVKIKQI